MSIVRNAPYNLANLIFAIGQKNPNRAAIVTTEASVTYTQLQDLVVSFAAHLRHHGIGRGSCIALSIHHPVVAVGLTIACALVGCSWVDATREVEGNKDLAIRHVLVDGEGRGTGLENLLRVDPNWSRPPLGQSVSDFEGYRVPTDIWVVLQSSGTTGTPKFMGMDELTMWKRTVETGGYRYTAIGARLQANPVIASLFPPLSYVGISDAFRAIALSGTIIFAELADFIGRTPVDIVVGAPGHFMQLLDLPPPPGPRIALAAVGGATAKPPFLAGMLRYFAAINDVYGSSEAGMITTNVVTDATDLAAVVSGGRPVPGALVHIVADDGTELPSGQEGIVKLRTPWQVEGYIGNPALTADIFRDGWFYPGDIGFLSAAGELHITGRLNDQLNISGVKLNPEVIDAVMLSVPGILDAACFTVTDTHGIDLLAAAIVITDPPGLSAILSALVPHLNSHLKPQHIPVQFHVLPALPRNPNGKIIRRQIEEAASGQKPIPLPTIS